MLAGKSLIDSNRGPGRFIFTSLSWLDSAVALCLDRVDTASLTGVTGLAQGKVLGGLLESFVTAELRKQE